MIWNCYHLKKQNTEFTRNQHIFKFSYLFKMYQQKNMSYTWTIISTYCNNCKKTLFKRVKMRSKEPQMNLLYINLAFCFPHNNEFHMNDFLNDFSCNLLWKIIRIAPISQFVFNHFWINMNLYKCTNSLQILCFILKNDDNLKSY